MAKKSTLDKVAGTKLNLERRRLDEIVEYENNPRVIEKAIPYVAESIRQCGYITPIVIDEDNIILAGHTRLNALKETGADNCEVVVVYGLTEEQKRKYRVLDNKTGEIATWDKGLLENEISGLDFNGFDFGFEEINTDSFKDIEGGADKESVICPRCKTEVIL